MKFTASSVALLALLNLADSLPSAEPVLLEKRVLPVVLGLAKTYGALSATALTSTGATLITGNIGVSPGTAITGFPPAVVTGSTNSGNSASLAAKSDCGTAYNNALSIVPTIALGSASLGGITLIAGAYTFPANAASLTGNLTLNAQNNANAQFIFKVTTTLSTAVNSKILLINGAKACNVFFAVGSSATMGAGTAFQGNIIAYTSISVANAVSNKGTLCALNGAVTLINDALTAQTTC